MGRTYSASLACLALASSIVHGWLYANPPEDVLIRGIVMLFVFAIVGWVIGHTAELVVRQSMEKNYRLRVEELRQTQSGAKNESNLAS